MAATRCESCDHGQLGQVLVLVSLALVALLAGAALVIDGGNAFAQQRVTQNAADSAANAGAILLMQDLVASNNNQSLPNDDAAVLAAINLKASDNGISQPSAYYTTITGDCILSDGTTTVPPCDLAVGSVQVGKSGTIPTVKPDTNGNNLCPLPPNTPTSTPALACGVEVYGSKTFQTFVAGVVGMGNLKASADATAVAGVLTTLCAAGQPCNFIPITFPTSITLCDGSGKQLNFGNGSGYQVISGVPLASGNEEIIGICGSGDGTVGWLAIAPEDGDPGWVGTTQCNGSIPDLICDITTPDNPGLTLPVWIQTVSGNTNDKNVDQAMNTLAGDVVGTYEFGKDQTIIIPLYDCVGTVDSQASTDTCAQAASKQGGQNNWFHVVAIASMVLDHAYINANNPECNEAPGLPFAGGNGKNGCLKGWLVDVSSPTGTIGLGNGAQGSTFGVQLIH